MSASNETAPPLFFVTAFLKEVEQQQESSRRDSDLATKRRTLLRIQQTLIAAQEVGDEKLQIVQTIQDLIENKARQLELDYRNLGECVSFSTSQTANCCFP
jgi:inhibitor-of-growth protein 1